MTTEQTEPKPPVWLDDSMNAIIERSGDVAWAKFMAHLAGVLPPGDRDDRILMYIQSAYALGKKDGGIK